MKIPIRLSSILILLLFLTRCNRAPEISGEGWRLPGKAEVYLTAKDTDHRLSKRGSISFFGFPQPDEASAAIMVDPNKTFQVIEGFGGALTDASAETFAKLPGSKQEELLEAYFDPEIGIGYSLCRMSIHTCDFSSRSQAYTEVKNDTLLNHFTIEQDRQYRIPLIKQALAVSDYQVKLFASPWSPPGWMKTNGSMLEGGKLRSEYRKAWARYFIRFIHAYEAEGIPVWGLTVQNEPMARQTWESCIYTAEEERDFVRDYLGPALEAEGLSGVKLMIWDHNRGILYQRAKVVLDDSLASQYVWGTGFHWYVGDHFENVRLVHDAFPDKKLLFTEGCVFSYDPERIDEWQWGEHYAESMLMDLNNWANGWVDWNILLDEQGGPNHVGNYCFAPVHADTEEGSLHYMNSYYYFGHFSKFIRPGAKRIIASSNDDNLLTTAFLNTDGKIAVVVLNMTDEEIPFLLWVEGRAARSVSPQHSIITLTMG